MFPHRYFPTRMFSRRYFADRAEAPSLPAMPTLTGYIIITVDGVRYGLWASRLDP